MTERTPYLPFPSECTTCERLAMADFRNLATYNGEPIADIVAERDALRARKEEQ